MSNKIDKLNPPQVLGDQCNEFNRDYLNKRGFHVFPYFADDEFEGEWKYKIRDTETGRIVVNHLQPSHADWHTYMLFAEAIRESMKIAEVQGKLKAIEENVMAQLKLHGIPESAYKSRMSKLYATPNDKQG